LSRIDGGAGDGEGVAIRIGVVAEDVEGDRLVFGGGGGAGLATGPSLVPMTVIG
jgi:hypothetical protein